MEARQMTAQTLPQVVHTAAARTRARAGFTLIEVMIAMVILAGVVLAMGMSTTTLGKSVRSSDLKNRAQSVADMQIGRARAWPTYSTLSQLAGSKFNGTADGLISTTTVSIDSASGKNLTTVSVSVNSTTTGALSSPVTRTVFIAP
jgi:prepilin-type N-terminal cleavage/methylation domain-containing protein